MLQLGRWLRLSGTVATTSWPKFEIAGEERSSSGDSAILRVALKPGRLERLDEVSVTILDETGSDHWAYGLPQGVTQEEAEAFVWGPWEFNTGASTQVVSNRTTRPRAYSLVTGRNWDRLGLRRTQPGRWMPDNPEQWRKQQAGKPIRLLFTCRRDGYEPWTVLYEVHVKPHLARTVF